MDFNTVASTRRSVRHFKASELNFEQREEKIKEAIDFVRVNAPSWKNSQTHRYYVALSEEKKIAVCEALSERNRPKCENAIALVVTAFEKNISGFNKGIADNELGNEWGAYDLGLSDSLFILKIRELGLDSLIMGLRDAKEIRKVFDIPETQEIGAVISIGIREGEVIAPPHKAIEEIVRFS